MCRYLFLILILWLPHQLLAEESFDFKNDERFEITLRALKERIALNSYYTLTKQYHRLDYVVDMQELVLDKPFFENVDLVESKLQEIHDVGQFDIYVIASIPYAPNPHETDEQIEEYKARFTWALYEQGFNEALASKGVIINIDGTIRLKETENKVVTVYTAYIGFGSSLSNATIQQGVEVLKNFNYYIGRTTSKTEACRRLVHNVYNTFIGSPNLDFGSSEYTLVYTVQSRWKNIYGVHLDDPEPRSLTTIETNHGVIQDYTGILVNQDDKQLLNDLSVKIDNEQELFENPKFKVYLTSDYHLSNSRSAIQLVYAAQPQIHDEEVILGFHFRSTQQGIEVQYEILIGDNFVYPEQKQKIAETFLLPFLQRDAQFGQILQEALFISLEYASIMSRVNTSFEKSSIPRDWWDNDNYFFSMSPEVAGIIDGSFEILGGAISMGELGVDIGGLAVDFVSDRYETIRSIQNEAAQVMYISLEGLAAYASLTDEEQEELIAEIQGEVTQEISDYFDLIRSGSREGRYEGSKLAFNVISTFVGVTELKFLFKTGKWTSATTKKIADLKSSFQGVNRREGIKNFLRSIFARQLARVVAKKLSFKPSWLPERIIEGNLDNPRGLIGVYNKTLPNGSSIADTKLAIEELDYPQTFASNFESSTKGGFKLLNTNRWYYQDSDQYWADFNRPWLDEIVSKKGDVVVLSNKTDDLLIYKWQLEDGKIKYLLDENFQKIKTGFGNEIEYMENLVEQGKYRWDFTNGVYKYVEN